MAYARHISYGAARVTAHRELHRAPVVAGVNELPGHGAVDVRDLSRVVQLRDEEQPLLLEDLRRAVAAGVPGAGAGGIECTREQVRASQAAGERDRVMRGRRILGVP